MLQNGICYFVEETAENLSLELSEALLTQTRNRTHLHIKSVQILEEPLHPLHHHLMILPPQLQLLQQLLPTQWVKQRSHLTLQVRSYRPSVAIVKFSLETFDLLGAQLIHLVIVLHVLLLCEHDLLIASRQEGLERR